MKKTWIKVKRGFLEPEHRTKMGIRVWLYLYIIDQADWDTGSVLEWRDKDAADDLQMPLSTLRQQRQELEDLGYITCLQKGYKQVITIMRWLNPRSYDGQEINIPQGNNQGNVQGNIQGNNQGTETSLPLHITHRTQITDHKSSNISAVAEPEYEPFNNEADMPQSFVDEYKPKKHGDVRYNHVAYSAFYSITKRKPNKAIIDYVIETIGDKPDVPLLKKCYTEWIARGYNPQAYKWLEWYVDGIPERLGKKDTKTTAPWSPTSPDKDYYDIINR